MDEKNEQREAMGGLGVVCGRCGGRVYMLTCNAANRSGHDWVLASVCVSCRNVAWIEGGCVSCAEAEV